MYKSFLLLTGVLVFLLGCKKLVEVSASDTQTETSMVFSNDRSATEALNGMYIRAMNTPGTLLNGGLSIYASLASDEFLFINSASPATQQFNDNALDSKNMYIATLYGSAYNALYNANSILEGVSSAGSRISDSTRCHLMGEAYVLRALVYSELVQLFGPVPLVLSTDGEKNDTASRATVHDVFAQIMVDLIHADSLLSSVYRGPTLFDAASWPRADKWSAMALQSRCLLYSGQFEAAISMADHIINEGPFVLETSLDSVFLAGSTETIYQLKPVTSFMNSAEGYYFLPSDNVHYSLTPSLLNSFLVGDRRLSSWVGSKSFNGNSYRYPAKYKIRMGPPYKEYNIVLRLAEVYLIRAEAKAQLNRISEAIEDLNTIHTRAGLPAITAILTRDEALAAISRERNNELFGEWGQRWFDLKRSAQAGKVLSIIKNEWNDKDTLFPLPISEVQLNSIIWQNSGYE